MQRNDRWPDDYDPDSSKSRPSSRRNSAGSRRNSLKKEKEEKRSPLNSSAHSTPKKTARTGREQNFDFVVTGKPLLKKSDRANSLPGTYHRRPSCDVTVKSSKGNRSAENKRLAHIYDARDDDMSLDLSQVSDFEDTNSKYGLQRRPPLATSTPKPKATPKGRSVSVHHQNITKVEKLRESSRSRESTFSCSRDSLQRTSSSASPYKCGVSTELDYSSVSPEYSGLSSADLSPRVPMSGRSQDVTVDSCCVSTCQDFSDLENTQIDRDRGEWARFWANYNHSMSTVPMRSYYDQCPTPYRTETIDLQDLDFSTEGSRKRSPEDMHNLNNIIRNEGLHLTPRETQNIIKCAHILGNVLTKAIDRRSREKDDTTTKVEELKLEIDPELKIKKKTLSLNLKETALPVEVKEEKRSETITTQTDISLPNTKSAPRIFESILRQLSRTTMEEKKEGENNEKKTDTIEEDKENGDEKKQKDETKKSTGQEKDPNDEVKKDIDEEIEKSIDKVNKVIDVCKPPMAEKKKSIGREKNPNKDVRKSIDVVKKPIHDLKKVIGEEKKLIDEVNKTADEVKNPNDDKTPVQEVTKPNVETLNVETKSSNEAENIEKTKTHVEQDNN